MTALKHTFTSTGAKFMAHEQAMLNLRNGKGQPIVTHLMPTDLCQDSCSFCSVQTRHGNTLPFQDMMDYLDILIRFGLRAVIVSGGGNPILYKCPKTGKNFNDLISGIHERHLDIGVITNGMALRKYDCGHTMRESWGTVRPDTLDKCTWIRISMSGLDHERNCVEVPDIDPTKTTLGFSYVLADIYDEPADHHHGKVSTVGDLITLGDARLKLKPTWWAKDRLPRLTEQIGHYVNLYKPRYCRLLPNCLEPAQISERCDLLQKMADDINDSLGIPDYRPTFVQHKPPHAPKNCWIGFLHPVMNSCGGIFPCDAVVLSVADIAYKEGRSEHRFANPWRLCHWSEVARLYEEPIHSLVDSQRLCDGCVFWQQNEILEGVVDGTADITPPEESFLHANFV